MLALFFAFTLLDDQMLDWQGFRALSAIASLQSAQHSIGGVVMCFTYVDKPCHVHYSLYDNWTHQPAWLPHHEVDRASASRSACMRRIAIEKLRLHAVVHHYRAHLLTAAKIRRLAAPSTFHTALLIDWKGLRVTKRLKHSNIASDSPNAFGVRFNTPQASFISSKRNGLLRLG